MKALFTVTCRAKIEKRTYYCVFIVDIDICRSKILREHIVTTKFMTGTLYSGGGGGQVPVSPFDQRHGVNIVRTLPIFLILCRYQTQRTLTLRLGPFSAEYVVLCGDIA
jgi:hypothetical protein